VSCTWCDHWGHPGRECWSFGHATWAAKLHIEVRWGERGARELGRHDFPEWERAPNETIGGIAYGRPPAAESQSAREIVKLDRTRDFATISGEPYQPPEFDRPIKYEQGGRCFDAQGCEIVPCLPLVRSGANATGERRPPRRRREALTKEYESLLKLLGGIAYGPYEWDFANAQSITAMVVSDALAVGLNINERAVCELLRQAAELVGTTRRKSGLPIAPSALAWCLEDRDLLLMLVGAMAKVGYGWCPSQARGKTATDVHSDVLRAGLEIDVDTVRKYLKRAAKLLALWPPKT